MPTADQPRPPDMGRSDDAAPVRRFLVVQEAGMSQLQWWVEASSAEEIERTFADVWVASDAVAARTSHAPVADPDDLPEALREAAAVRNAQRDRPGFGALVGRGTVYLRGPWPDEDEIYLTEHRSDGWRLRQVVLRGDGSAVRYAPDDYWINLHADLWDPDLAEQEITAAEFEAAWANATPFRRD